MGHNGIHVYEQIETVLHDDEFVLGLQVRFLITSSHMSTRVLVSIFYFVSSIHLSHAGQNRGIFDWKASFQVYKFYTDRIKKHLVLIDAHSVLSLPIHEVTNADMIKW